MPASNPSLTRQRLRRMSYALNFAANARIRAHHRRLDRTAAEQLAAFERGHYKNVTDEGDVSEALAGALLEDRMANVPWLDAAIPLDGARVLEIGSGTAESTLALSEQGAHVTGLDVDAAALDVGRERLRLYGLEPDLRLGNAASVAEIVKGERFDLVIFFASLEHMTLAERLGAIEQTWDLLKPGGCWCVIEAPNRLWFWDGHTSMDNFYHWLPDELAARWAHRSSRAHLAADFPAIGNDAPADFDTVKLARWGRGVSYHEFELVLGDAKNLDLVSNKTDFLRRSNPLLFAHGILSRARRYERFLERISPGYDRGWFKQYLDLIIRKPL